MVEPAKARNPPMVRTYLQEQQKEVRLQLGVGTTDIRMELSWTHWIGCESVNVATASEETASLVEFEKGGASGSGDVTSGMVSLRFLGWKRGVGQLWPGREVEDGLSHHRCPRQLRATS